MDVRNLAGTTALDAPITSTDELRGGPNTAPAAVFKATTKAKQYLSLRVNCDSKKVGDERTGGLVSRRVKSFSLLTKNSSPKILLRLGRSPGRATLSPPLLRITSPRGT